MVEGPDLTADDVLPNPFPMVNTAGINGMFLPWLKVGGLLVQHHPFDLATFLGQIEQHRATYTCAPPALLEGFIAGHPKVADVAVVAYPDEVLGERACAVVVPRPGQSVTLEEIVAYLRNLGIATFKLPERLEIREELPRNPLGKILKRELRDELRQ